MSPIVFIHLRGIYHAFMKTIEGPPVMARLFKKIIKSLNYMKTTKLLLLRIILNTKKKETKVRKLFSIELS